MTDENDEAFDVLSNVAVCTYCGSTTIQLQDSQAYICCNSISPLTDIEEGPDYDGEGYCPDCALLGGTGEGAESELASAYLARIPEDARAERRDMMAEEYARHTFGQVKKLADHRPFPLCEVTNFQLLFQRVLASPIKPTSSEALWLRMMSSAKSNDFDRFKSELIAYLEAAEVR